MPNGVNTQDFWNRKQFYSLNTQIVGDGNNFIRAIDPRWAGSTHDARVYRNSIFKDWLETQDDFITVADSAYPISKWLIKPYYRPQDPNKRRFNKALSGIRTICTENTVGIWKRRFPCLYLGLRTKLKNTARIVVACACLHNMALQRNDDLPDDDLEEEMNDQEDEDIGRHIEGENENGIRIRGQQMLDGLLEIFLAQ